MRTLIKLFFFYPECFNERCTVFFPVTGSWTQIKNVLEMYMTKISNTFFCASVLFIISLYIDIWTYLYRLKCFHCFFFIFICFIFLSLSGGFGHVFFCELCFSHCVPPVPLCLTEFFFHLCACHCLSTFQGAIGMPGWPGPSVSIIIVNTNFGVVISAFN